MTNSRNISDICDYNKYAQLVTKVSSDILNIKIPLSPFQMVHHMQQYSQFAAYPQTIQSKICQQGWYAK